MSHTVISVEHLSKQYDLGVIGTGTLTRDFERWWARARGKPDPYSPVVQDYSRRHADDSILALDDVSFTVQRGEALGIIGRNGAGKSTLLKILSRVTAPTSGVVKVKGRIGSLLEVGTGFHPELTGRENVYLNGAILGMKKAEVARKFDEIVAFSGVEKFIDTPVKRYSSGMYVRLAFAVAAHLDPEILIVDEVLAVGDAEFQKKAVGKMQDVSRQEGRTVLFVSHNMAAVKSLCKSCLLLVDGSIKSIGKPGAIIDEYFDINLGVDDDFKGFKDLRSRKNIYGNVPIFESIEVKNKDLITTNIIRAGEPLVIDLELNKDTKIQGNIGIGVYFYRRGVKVGGITSFMGMIDKDDHLKENSIELVTEPLNLIPDTYQIEIVLANKGVKRLDHVENAGNITIVDNDVFGNGEVINDALGYFFIRGRWYN